MRERINERKKNRDIISISITDSLLKHLKEHSKREQISTSEFVEFMLRSSYDYINKRVDMLGKSNEIKITTISLSYEAEEMLDNIGKTFSRSRSESFRFLMMLFLLSEFDGEKSLRSEIYDKVLEKINSYPKCAVCGKPILGKTIFKYTLETSNKSISFCSYKCQREYHRKKE